MFRKAAMPKKAAPAAAAVVAIVIAGVLLGGPALVQRYGEHKIDQSLAKIGFETTSSVRRGNVTVDVWHWTVSVENLEISGAGRASTVSIGRLTVRNPQESDGRLTAASVVVDDFKLAAESETVSLPRVEISNYSGPERGLTATPGLDRSAITRADLLAQVSIGRVVAPVANFTGHKSRVRRTLTNIVIDDVRDGVISTATADLVTVQAPFLEPGAPLPRSSLAASAKRIFYKSFDVPALVRLYGGDPGAHRDQLLEIASASDIEVTITTRRAGKVKASAGEVRLENVGVRALDFPLSAFDPIAIQTRSGEDATPQEVRDQLAFAVDISNAISFDKIRVEDAKIERTSDGLVSSASFALAEIGPYADARIGSVRFEKAGFAKTGGAHVALASGEIAEFDASGLASHARKISRDEVLLTAQPTAEEIVRITPRIRSIEARGLDSAGEAGTLKIDRASADVDAKLDAVPQHVKLKLDGLNAAPAGDSTLKTWIDALELDRLKGSAKIALTFDPNQKALSVDKADYDVEGFGRMSASGRLEEVDPLLAIATGAAFVEKFSAIRLAPVKIDLRDAGATEVLLRRAAERAKQAPEEFREAFAKEVQDTTFRVLGPSAENSAESAARFIRDPRGAEVTIAPRNLDQSLLDLIAALGLGPAGWAQVVDVAVLYKR